MADTEYKRLIQASKERALFGFLAVAQRAIQDAERAVAEQQSDARSGSERTALTAVRHFLRQDSAQLLHRAELLYRGYLDRAFQTMFVDLRPGMRKLSADELTLIDDDVVHHQIEVGRLAERMRDANEETIGRLNVIVAQLHGQTEARERENPFRPYLLARALYEAVKDTAGDEARARTVFEFLSAAVLLHLPGFYQSVRDTFGAFGVQGKYVMQRSRNPHNPRHYHGPTAEAAVTRGLQRMIETLQASQALLPVAGAAGQTPAGSVQAPDIQDFIRRMFSSPRSPQMPGGPARQTVPVNPLVAELGRHQKQAQPVEPSQLRASLSLDKASVIERMTVDVVGMLFDFIREDETIPAALRQQICRLQIPLLKAAVLEPDLLHDEGHPARQLLNRVSSAAVGCDPGQEAGRTLETAIGKTVQRVCDEFGTDTRVFADCLQEFDQFLAGLLRQDHSQGPRAAEAVEAAERLSILLTRATRALCDVLLPMNADKRISDFIIHAWPHVLVQACWQDVEAGHNDDHPQSLYRQCHDVLADLLWSVQEKQSPPERNALIRLLPDLVRRLRMGMALIQMDEGESKALLDLLMEIHTGILRGTGKAEMRQLPTLDELRAAFARVVVNWERVAWEQDEPPQPRATLIEEVFARRAIAAELHTGTTVAIPGVADREFLAQTWLLGTRVEFLAADGQRRPGQLVWISTHRSLYLFRREGRDDTVLYTYSALLEALRDESLVPVEYAPVFERAVESLLLGAGRLAQPA